MYSGERADAVALDVLELVVRELGEELAGWRTRALKAEGELKTRGAPRAPHEGELAGSSVELEAENRALQQRIDVARTRVAELVSRLSFLEEQARVSVGGNGSGR